MKGLLIDDKVEEGPDVPPAGCFIAHGATPVMVTGGAPCPGLQLLDASDVGVGAGIAVRSRGNSWFLPGAAADDT